jgi:hypothetical protein
MAVRENSFFGLFLFLINPTEEPGVVNPDGGILLSREKGRSAGRSYNATIGVDI